MSRLIMQVDLDAFFTAVEQRDHPPWRGLPRVVGAEPGKRGVVATCSYEARGYGISSALNCEFETATIGATVRSQSQERGQMPSSR